MRYRWVYGDDGHIVAQFEDDRCVYVDESFKTPAALSFQVMPDIQPYRSMIDGSVISSRSRHREHLRAHGCVEVGNDSSLYRPPKPLESPPGLKEKIIRAVNEVEERDRRKKCH